MTRFLGLVLAVTIGVGACGVAPATAPVPSASPSEQRAESARKRAVPAPRVTATPQVVGGIFGAAGIAPTAAPTATANPTPVVTATPTAVPTTAPTSYAATVVADQPCAFYRLNDVPAPTLFTSTMFDTSANANAGNYATALSSATGIVNNDGSATALLLPGGTWLNTQQAFGPANIAAQKPTSAVQLEMWYSPQLVGAAAIIDRGGVTGTSGVPTFQQSFTYNTALAAGESSSVVALGMSGTQATNPQNGDYLVAVVTTSNTGTGGTVTTPAGWSHVASSQQSNSWVAQDVFQYPVGASPPANVTFAYSGAVLAEIKVIEVSGTAGVDIVTKATANVTTPFTTTTGTGTQAGLNDLGFVAVSMNDAITTPAAITGYTSIGNAGIHGNGTATFGHSSGFYVTNSLITAASVPAQSTTWTDAGGTEAVLGLQVLMKPSGVGGAGSPYRLSMDSGGHFVFSVNVGGTVQSVTSTTVAVYHTIYHVVGTYTGASQYITVNNSKQGTAAMSGAVSGYDTTSGVAIGGLYANDNATLQANGIIASVALYGSGATGCNSGVISDARITAHYNFGTGATAPTPTPAPTSTPTPAACPTVPPLTNGAEVGGGFVPYSCTTSPWNHLLTIPAGGHPTYAPYSSTVITTQWSNANTLPVRSQESGFSDNAYSIYYADNTMPLINLRCDTGLMTCDNVDNGGLPATIRIPPQARFAPSSIGSDSIISVVQCGASIASCQNGTEISMYVYSPGANAPKGSLSNGNWQTGDTMHVGGAVNNGNWSTGTGVTTTFGVNAGGNPNSAGQLKANELLAGQINHQLKLLLDCAGPGATVYPAFANTLSAGDQGVCTGGVNSGPPIGGLLWYDVPCTTTRASATLQIWEKGVLCALNQYGALFMDVIAGGTFAKGMFFLPSGGQMFQSFGFNSPYAALTSQGWVAGAPLSGDTDGPRYTAQNGSDQWNPTGFSAAYWQAHMHWLDPCEAHNPRSC